MAGEELMSLHFFAAHKVVTVASAAAVGVSAWLGTVLLQTTAIWPVTVTGWIALFTSVTVLIGGALAYFKTYVIFRASIADGFAKLDDRIGLAKGQTVVGVIDGQGKRIDGLASKLAEINGLPEKVRNLEREQLKQHAEVKSCLDETRANTQEARDILHKIDKRIFGIETTLKIEARDSD